MKLHENRVLRKPICSIRMDGQTDMTKVIVVFLNFSNAPKNGGFIFSRKTVPVHETTRTYVTEYINCYLNVFPTGEL